MVIKLRKVISTKEDGAEKDADNGIEKREDKSDLMV